jgi:hypothetical protein
MAAAVQERIEAQCKKAPAPDPCIARGLADPTRPSGRKDPRVFLLEFGWNNCANQYTLRNAEAVRRDQMRTNLQGDFRRVFKVTEEVECRIHWAAANDSAPPRRVAPSNHACPSSVFTEFFEQFLTSAPVQRRFTNLPLPVRDVDASRLGTDAEFISEMVESFEKAPITFGSDVERRIVPNRVEMSEEKIHFEIKYGVDKRSRQQLARVSFYKEDSDSFSVDYIFFRNKSCWLLRKIDNNSL